MGTRKILFVDDEENVLSGLRRMLYPMRNEWDMCFANSGEQALEILAAQPIDVIVTDMQMPGMTGEMLLQKVQQAYPNTIRMVLSGHAAEENVIKAIGPTHQYMSKPCDAEWMQNVIRRACQLRNTLKEEAIKSIVTKIDSLPSIPSIYYEVIHEAELPDASIQKLGTLISKDIGMSTKILQLVNSAFFGLFRQISNPGEAINLLGLERVKTLILGIHIFNKFEKENTPSFSIEDLWMHSMQTSGLAKKIIKESGYDKVADQFILPAMLHDIGKLILAASMPEKYSEVIASSQKRGLPAEFIEEEIFHTTHAEVGAYLLGIWGMPDSVVEGVAFHHRPKESLNTKFSPLTVTHIANAFEHALQENVSNVADMKIDYDYLSLLEMTGQVEALWELCMDEF